MANPLLQIDQIDELPDLYLRRAGDVFAEFGAKSQDSGNVSYGIRIDDKPLFVKTTGIPDAPLAGPKSPTHPQRIQLLRNAIAVSESVSHPALPELHNVIESPTGPLLVYEWAPGLLVQKGRAGRPIERFRNLPLDELMTAINTIYDVLDLLADAGWITEDFYDGCIIYDFDSTDLHIIDLDHCHPGPFTNTMGRMFGSSRFMAPEEFVKGAQIDHRTATFLMGRIAAVYLSDNSLDRKPFRGSDAQHAVMVRSCQENPDDRYQTESDFLAAWRNSS